MAQIRLATTDDIDGIVAIYNQVQLDREQLCDPEYCSRIQKRGFLVGPETRDSLYTTIGSAYEFLVSIEKGLVNGFLIANIRDKFTDDEYKTWFDPKIKREFLYGMRSITFAAIAVDPASVGLGVAAKLYTQLEKDLITDDFRYLFSVVTVAPVTNCPSIIWHTRHGFKRLAMSKPQEKIFDLDWHSSILFYKDLLTS
jgi:ribosomal protein S18 acetylase RimI-like enzyme